MARSLNKVTLIGNLTKDPELKYTPKGSAVCQFTVATNREWKDSTGQEKAETTFHRIVAWSKLAEIIPQFTVKGSKVFVEGRIVNRQWKDKDGVDHYITEIVANEVIALDNRKKTEKPVDSQAVAPKEKTEDFVGVPPEPSTN